MAGVSCLQFALATKGSRQPYGHQQGWEKPSFFFKKQDSVLFSRRIEKPHSELFLSHHAISPFSESYNNYKLCLQLKAIVFLYAFEESVNCALLSFFCDDSNLHISLFKYVLSTMGVSKESISKFLIGNRFHVKLRILSPSIWIRTEDA